MSKRYVNIMATQRTIIQAVNACKISSEELAGLNDVSIMIWKQHVDKSKDLSAVFRILDSLAKILNPGPYASIIEVDDSITDTIDELFKLLNSL